MAEFDGYSAELAADTAEFVAEAVEFEAHTAVRPLREWPQGGPGCDRAECGAQDERGSRQRLLCGPH
jgi:hypothetical protein